MMTRMQKWKRYRRKIERTPDYKLPHDDNSITKEYEQVSDGMVLSREAGTVSKDENKNNKNINPYNDYKKHEIFILIIKIILLIMAIIGFICLYVYWVR